MTRLPTVGGDEGNWGNLLNDYLSQSHAPDGALKTQVVGAPQLKQNAVTSAAIAPGAVTSAAIADAGLPSAKLSDKGQAGGIAALDGNGNILTSSGQEALTSTTVDAEIAAKVTDIGSATMTALNATYASLAGLGIFQAVNYGIKADGTTDNTAVLNALMETVSAAGGGHIVLPPGVIRLTTTLIQKNNVHLSGAGREITILKPEQHGFYLNATATAPILNFHLSDLTIDGANRTGAKTWKGYHGQYHRRCSWTNLTVRNTGMTGLGPDFLDECVIMNCLTEDTGLENDGTMASGNGIGIGAGGSQGTPEWPAESLLITGCTVKRAKRFGIMYEGGITPQSVKIIGNTVSGCEAGFDISGGTGAIIIGNNSYSNVGAGFHVGSATLASSLAGQKGRIMGNFAHQNGGPGILYEADVHAPSGHVFSITENTITENVGDGVKVSTKTSDIRHLEISRNTIYNNSGVAIGVYAVGAYTYTSLAVVGNRCIHNGIVSPSPGTQIGIGAPTNGLLITENIFDTSAGTDTTLAAVHLGYNGYNVSVDLQHVRPTITNNRARRHGTFLKQTGTQTITEAVIAGNVGQGGLPVTPRSSRTITADATLASTDDVVISNGAATIYLPPTGMVSGQVFTVKNKNATTVNVRTPDGKSIDGVVGPVALAQWAKGSFMYDGTNWLTV